MWSFRREQLRCARARNLAEALPSRRAFTSPRRGEVGLRSKPGEGGGSTRGPPPAPPPPPPG
ncbi:hypothetical protein P3G22_23320, partial [Rhodopseudomonas sp. BAL398]|nr:hypothetical protein [Rhodopseudomonas sp. BAL398]